ncbi:glycosyltransferase [Actinomyces sp. Marseille-P3109]|uniref:glycosyltransferase n=1 Tax=Actinomyces sp. Marseille-P3109 TaxID=2083009 RepID=UPI001F37D41A|nr:glycosyltransferase [Actinomyces sp. Marseille-P3109]
MRARPVPAMTLRRARELARRLRREEDGQTLLLGVGLICVVLALLFVAASATAIYLDLKTLTSLADSAAAAGADGLEEDSYYGGNGTDTAPAALTDAQVRTNAAADLSAQPSAARLEGVTMISARADPVAVMVKPSAGTRRSGRRQACSTKLVEMAGEGRRCQCIRARSSSFCRRESWAM